MMSRRILAAAVAFAAVFAAAPSAAASEEELELTWSLLAADPVKEWTDEKCDAAADTCTVTYVEGGEGRRLRWSLADPATATEVGRLAETCDSILMIELRTNGAQDRILGAEGVYVDVCVWRFELAEGSLVGRTTNVAVLSTVDAATLKIESAAVVEVAAGTGAYANSVGEGTYAQERLLSISELEGSAYQAAQARRALGGRSNLRLRLRRGYARALVTSSETVTKRDDDGLRVVTAPGASCRANAKSGARFVNLGRGVDGDRDGTVVIAPKLKPKLAPGRWKIAISCSYRAGGRSAIAATAATVTVRR